MDLPQDAPSPRLCHLIKWPDFDGYGFNLHAEKSKTGQYIGKVDQDSPAQLAGLKEGDRIIEVNGVNISNENHRQVVERIKSVPNETKLLVLDDISDRWYKERKIIVKNNLANVLYIKTPVAQPVNQSKSQSEVNHEDNHDQDSFMPTSITPTNGDNTDRSQYDHAHINGDTNGIKHHHDGHEHDIKDKVESNNNINEDMNGSIKRDEDTILENGANSSSHSDSHSHNSSPRSQSRNKEQDRETRPSSAGSNSNANTSSIPSSPISSTKSGSLNGGGNGIANEYNLSEKLNMTASQMRQLLAQKKKHDAKKAQIDLRQKYDIIQQM